MKKYRVYPSNEKMLISKLEADYFQVLEADYFQVDDNGILRFKLSDGTPISAFKEWSLVIEGEGK